MSSPRTITVLTPDPRGGYGARVDVAMSRFAAAFARHDARVTPRPWTEGPVAGADLHLAALAWGYDLQAERWRGAIAAWPASAPLVNAPQLLLWNTRKTYLRELEAAGVAVIPTAFVDDPAELATAIETLRRRHPGDLVIKPQISAGGRTTFRLSAADAAPSIAGGVMLQPFLPAVAGEGELSLFLFDGRCGHAIAKRAPPGGFKVQPQHGGCVSAITPDADALALAHAAIAAAPAPPAYARVDMVRDSEGRVRVMELEAIEPDLYPDFAPDGLDGFVQAVLGRI